MRCHLDNSDLDLAEKIKSGEKDGFSQMFEKYSRVVVNTCYRFVGNQEDAEDVAQEVFIECYKSISAFRWDCSLSTWIYRITVSKSMDFIRRKKRKKRWAQLKQVFSDDGDEDQLFKSCESDSPESVVLSREKMKLIMTAMDSLPENQRVAFTLCRVKGFSQKEVAEILNTTEKAVESLNVRAKKKLKYVLTGLFEKKYGQEK